MAWFREVQHCQPSSQPSLQRFATLFAIALHLKRPAQQRGSSTRARAFYQGALTSSLMSHRLRSAWLCIGFSPSWCCPTTCVTAPSLRSPLLLSAWPPALLHLGSLLHLPPLHYFATPFHLPLPCIPQFPFPHSRYTNLYMAMLCFTLPFSPSFAMLWASSDPFELGFNSSAVKQS